jgi:quercetin dioxygenase-like cupin family protein
MNRTRLAAALLERIHTLLESRRAPRLDPFLAEWPTEAPSRRVTPRSLPVLRHASVFESTAPAWGRSVTAELLRLAPSLQWGQSYPASEVGAQFLENYAWTEIAGLHGPIPSERVAIGFLMLGPATLYPRHRHEAEEIYVPVSGTAAWQGGDGIWRNEPPGVLIVHGRHEPHAMQTSSEPLLALYLWRSAQLDQKSQLD